MAATPETIALGLTAYVVLLFSLSVHESAHGWAAYRMGDDTALAQGRVTLNPLAHIDPVGTLVIPLLQIFWGGVPLLGWAKPTPVAAHNFQKLARGHVLVAGAGPASNMLLTLVFTLLLFSLSRSGLTSWPSGLTNGTGDVLFRILVIGVQMNVALALFNLVPLPPLDGSWIVSWGLPRSIADRYDRIVEPLGPWLLLALLFPISWLLRPIGALLNAFLLRMAL